MRVALSLLARSRLLLALLSGEVAFAPELFLELAQALLLVVRGRGLRGCRHGRFLRGGR
jgi:hypothetical protein